MKYYDLYPASVVVDAIEPVLTDARFIADLLRKAKPAGVGCHLHFAEEDESETFAFADGDVEQDDTARGFSDEAETAGGKMIGAF